MSLAIWLPLNGNVNNQGASFLNMVVASSGSTLTETGKVTQKCYRNNSYTTGSYVSEEQVNLGQNQSVFAWVKVSEFNSNASLAASIAGQHRYPTNVGMGMTIKYVSSTTGYLSVNTGNGSSRTFNTYCGSTLLSANTWYHLGYTYDGSTIRLYVNGQLDGSHSFTGMVTPADYFMVGGWSFSGSTGNAVYANYKLNGYINDVRAYNHTLSAKEIKELAKGLCCHYKFNFEDLYQPIEYIEATGTQYINVPNVSWDYWEVDGQYTSTSSEMALVANYDGGSGNRWELFCDASRPYFNIWTASQGTTAGTTSATQRTTITYTKSTGSVTANGTSFATKSINSRPAFLFQYGGNNYYAKARIYHYKMSYNGSTTLDFIPCIRRYDGVAGLFDTIGCKFYTNAGSGTFSYPIVTVDTQVIDDSGYGNDATKTNVSVTDSTVLGNAAITMSGSGYVRLVKELLNGAFTVSVWAKTSSTATQCLFCDRGGTGTGPALFFISGGTVRFDTVNSNFSTAFTFSDGQWHLYTATYDGANRKIYIDGTLKATTATTSYGALGGVLAIGGSYASSSSTVPNGNWFNGSIADWRLYSTALSATNITELYQAKEAIDKAGNFYCNAYSEDSTTIGYTKKSVTKCNNFGEGMNKVSMQSSYTQLEYLEASGTQYIDTGLNFNLNDGFYEVKAQATTASQNGFILGDWTTSNKYYWLYHYQSGSTIRMYATNSGGSQVNFQTGLTSSNTNANTYLYKNKTMYVNGVETASQASVTFSSPTGNCWLFKASGSSGANYPYKGRIFYTKLWMNGKLVRYFVPVKKNSDSSLGMLDLINNVFYPNAGTGTFTAGVELGKITSIYTNKIIEV